MAVAFPDAIRTNAYWKNRHPDLVAAAEQHTLAQVWSTHDSTPESLEFDEEMLPFAKDPFRGTEERRVLMPGQVPSELELAAARDVIAAAGITPKDVGLMIVGSFLPDRVGNGNAPFVARDLGLTGAAWNIESACSTTLPALETAHALVQCGAYERVLVVVSCTYSRVTNPSDSLSWFLGDGAGAWLVGHLEGDQGILGMHLAHTGETCGAAWFEPTFTPEGEFRAMMRSARHTGRLFRDLAKPTLLRACHGAMERAGVTEKDIALFVFNTPTAWYARFGARCLGVAPERAVDYYRYYGNIGPALPTTSLFHAAHEGRLKKNDLVLVYCIGSVSSAGAVVMRWGDVKLGPPPSRAGLGAAD
jgi:3-oxoacyl-[acyl-carrier-protein] synthase-3